MIHECKIRVQPSDREAFEYKATFVFDDLAVAGGLLDARYLYGSGDLAVFLEDLGADVPAILDILGRIGQGQIEEIRLSPTEEALEVLCRPPAQEH
jgi:hypothetical protein